MNGIVWYSSLSKFHFHLDLHFNHRARYYFWSAHTMTVIRTLFLDYALLKPFYVRTGTLIHNLLLSIEIYCQTSIKNLILRGNMLNNRIEPLIERSAAILLHIHRKTLWCQMIHLFWLAHDYCEKFFLIISIALKQFTSLKVIEILWNQNSDCMACFKSLFSGGEKWINNNNWKCMDFVLQLHKLIEWIFDLKCPVWFGVESIVLNCPRQQWCTRSHEIFMRKWTCDCATMAAAIQLHAISPEQ